jgi:hypothetical protein
MNACTYCGLGRTVDTDHNGTVTVDHRWCEAEYVWTANNEGEAA